MGEGQQEGLNGDGEVGGESKQGCISEKIRGKKRNKRMSRK